MGLKFPMVERKAFIEHRGEYRMVEVEDRPYRVVEEFDELRGERREIQVELTDIEVLEAGGIKRFFNDDGTRRDGSWPYDPDTAPAPRSKKKAKRKAKKKASKK